MILLTASNYLRATEPVRQQYVRSQPECATAICASSSVRWGGFLYAEAISWGQVSDVAHTEANII
jgi:hypothetical protein